MQINIMEKKKLAIINADKAQIPLVKKAMEMGVETHCFAWDKETYNDCKGIADYYHPISILEKEKILETCKEININGITSIRHDFSVPIVAYIAEKMGLPGNRYEDMLIAAGSKFTMRQAFSKNGVKSPRYTNSRNCTDLSEFQYPLIVKPVDRCASIGVMKVNNETELKEAIDRAKQLSYTRDAIIEEFVTGIEVTIDMISWQGIHYPISMTETETTGAPYYTKIGYHGPPKFNDDIQNKIIIEAKKALTALNFNYGASDTEVIVTETGEVKLIEINPRMGGDSTDQLVRLSTGYDFLKGAINLALGQFEIPVFPYKKYAGIYYCLENTEWIKKVIEEKENNPEIVEAVFFKEEDKRLGRIGYFIYQTEQKRRWT